ncbi:MAG: hypothetical protein JF597_39670 [Streptomyces sp.]|uniref:hypothetical protein n=1 Tax=Streptomyces sp. TaxID=1931 RepID=UPI0025DAFD2A|nr:hypothetical protein [Streptomyces sp.]MBW8799481.1 hypothetical protein [Streptomyces sp.]
MASENERSVDELFAELPEKWQRSLEEVGMGLPELRRIAAGPDGMRRVRTILAEFSEAGPASRPPRMVYGGATPVWPWARLLLVAVVSVAVCLLSSLFVGKAAAFVGLLLGLPVIRVAFKTRDSRGAPVARYVTAAAYLVLVLVGSYFANAWYLQLRGVEQTVTIATPTHQWTHGTRETYCRVRLRDGSVHEVVDNRENCADRIGQTTTAVVDPAGHYKPSLGTKSEMGGLLEGYVCLGAAVVLVLAPVTVVAVGRRNRYGQAMGTAV